MLSLQDDIRTIPNIGPKYQKLLEKLEIYTVKDLIYHFPFRYDNFAEVKAIKDVLEGETVTVKATLGPLNNIVTRNRKRITKAEIFDFTGQMEVIWFNQHYLKKSLKTGIQYSISGKVNKFSGKLCLISPELEPLDSKNLNTGRLVPIYPETAGVSSRWLRAKIEQTLKQVETLEEILPKDLLNEENLKDIKWAISQMHFPDSLKEAELARKRLAFEELLIELLKVEKRKTDWDSNYTAHKLAPYTDEINDFIHALPFELTPSQKEALQEITTDMQTQIPMNRLLEGDVGTGKTIVAIISSYLAYLNGFQVLYMAPTEILAKQHFETFKEFFKNVQIDIHLITSTTKTIKKSKETSASHNRTGKKFDILIGTHSLLFNENYTNVGLVIIDEQHRFGVEQRENLVKLGQKVETEAVPELLQRDVMKPIQLVPHFLSMSATPIPRTLALTLYGDLDISTLKAPESRKRDTHTKVTYDTQRQKVYEWIKEKKEQAFIVCPLIEQSEHESLENVKAAEVEFAELSSGVLKGVKVGLLHGRMKPKEKEAVVEQFRQGEIEVLVSTPVIEVGIDIPDAAVIVIESAERYGLASLHQLRGRVGRSGSKSFCFLIMSNFSKKGYARLKNLENISDGLELAEIDMKYRGQGDIFGTEQHGFKTLRVASFSDMDLLQRAKLWTKRIFSKPESYSEVFNKIEIKNY